MNGDTTKRQKNQKSQAGISKTAMRQLKNLQPTEYKFLLIHLGNLSVQWIFRPT